MMSLRTIYGEFDKDYILNCQRNIYSEDDCKSASSDSDAISLTGFPTRRQRFQHLEKELKRDDKVFPDISFKNNSKGQSQKIMLESNINENKKAIVDTIYQRVLLENSVKPDRFAELDLEYLKKEVKFFEERNNKFVKETNSSYMYEAMPYRELPEIEEGNYSMCLHDHVVSDVNNWIKQDMMTPTMAVNDLKHDLEKFNEFDSFNVSSLNPIKFKNELTFLVDHFFQHCSPNVDDKDRKMTNEFEVRKYPTEYEVYDDYRQFLKD